MRLDAGCSILDLGKIQMAKRQKSKEDKRPTG